MWLGLDEDSMHRFDDHPAPVRRLIEALVDPTEPPAELGPLLERIAGAKPERRGAARFRKLLARSRTRRR